MKATKLERILTVGDFNTEIDQGTRGRLAQEYVMKEVNDSQNLQTRLK